MGASAGQDGTGGVPPIPPDGDDDCTRLFRMVNRNSWIAFDSNSDSARRSIFIMRPDASVVEQLTKGVNLDVEPSLSPDGKSVSFTSDRAGVSQIFIMHLEQRTPRQLTFRPEGADQSAFSRDGKLIAFHSGAAIYTINVDGSDERLVATGATASDGYFGPEFSADGAELVFDRTYEIDAVRLDGSGLRTIVRNVTTVMKAPAVSFEGTEIAYDVSCDTGKSSVWISPVAATTNRCGEQRVTLIGDFKLGQPLEAKRPTWISSTVLAYEYVHDDTKLGSIGLTSRTGREICLVGPAAADCRNPSGAP
jgi:Tol biopolymer transport system component